jgi:folate-binding Fe-S cluster repair protein YgfZ
MTGDGAMGTATKRESEPKWVKMLSKVIALNDRTVLKISGPDAKPFLQGLVTNDMARLAPGQPVYAALLTAQGKVISDFILSQAGEVILLDCAASRAADLAARLKKFRLRAKVQVEEAGTQSATVVLVGRSIFFEDGDSGALGQTTNGRAEVHALVFHDKFEDAAAGTAAEAVVSLLLRADMERGGFLAVEGAERPPTGAGAFEREIAADDLDDVAGGCDALNAFLGNTWHATECSR